MRRTVILFALMISLLCLSGCGGTAEYEEKFIAFREALSQSEEISLTANVTATAGDVCSEYRLSCSRVCGESVVEVISPSQLAGVRARVKSGSLELEYDGVVLSAGELSGEGLEPVSVAPCLLDALETGHLMQCWTEKDENAQYIAVKLSITDQVFCQVWLEAESMAPAFAEIYDGTNMTARCELESWAA